MSLTMLTLDLNYLKLRHHLVAASYTLRANSTHLPEQAADIADAICGDCNNRLAYQEWIGPAGRRALAVCLGCYQAAALD